VADYASAISRSQGSDPLVQQPLSPGRKRKMAHPDVATMRKLQQQGKALPPQQPGGRPRFNIQNATDLDNAIKAVGRVRPATDEARAAVRRFIIMRARQLGLSSHIPDTWNADGDLITPANGKSGS
jgi:hypothetical protein